MTPRPFLCALGLGLAGAGARAAPAHAAGGGLGGPPRWPALRPVDTVFAVAAPDAKVLIHLPLADRAGRVRYTLACRGRRPPAVSDDGLPDSLWGAGALVCRLHAGHGDDASTLLVSDESPIWHTHGFVWYADLADPARRVRTFRLRGFALGLRFDQVAFAGPVLRAFALRVTVRPDPRAAPAVAAATGPRMCRNWTAPGRLGSWEHCRGR